jgi:glycosyltransferase involved in cell wall biosynthesis
VEQIHVLFLIDVLYSVHGGAEGVLLKMTQLLPADRFRCSVATLATHADRVVADRFACPVHLLPIRRMYDANALKTALRLARLIRSERISIVHTFFPASDLLGGLVARLSGCPVLISSRRDMGFQRSALHRYAYRLARGMFDQVHAVSESVRRAHIGQDGLDPARVVTLYNGVDLGEINAVCAAGSPADKYPASGVPRVVCVANIRPVKDLEMFVSTAAVVCRSMPAARFMVAGAVQDAGYMGRVAEMASLLGLGDKIEFLGPVPNVPSLLRQCDVFYLPSRSEGLSNALLEAMACGLPCVATDVGGNGELVENATNGYLVRSGDCRQAAARLLDLLRDPSRAREMGRAGRRLIESKFSVETMIARLTESYEGLLAGVGKGRLPHAAAGYAGGSLARPI